MFDFAFNSFEEAIYMNGHGIYVWIVLFIVVSCITIFFITYRKKIQKIKKKLNFGEVSKFYFMHYIYSDKNWFFEDFDKFIK